MSATPLTDFKVMFGNLFGNGMVSQRYILMRSQNCNCMENSIEKSVYKSASYLKLDSLFSTKKSNKMINCNRTYFVDVTGPPSTNQCQPEITLVSTR